MTEPRDTLYRRCDAPGDFVFDARVARVFPDMIARSVPGYAAILNMLELLVEQHARPATRLYDLGCSLGAASLAMARGLRHEDCEIVAVDNAPAMLERARERLAASPHPVRLVEADVREQPIERASVVVLNFTLQFVPVADRSPLLRRVRSGMVPEGVLVLSEKIAGDTPESDRLLVGLHHAFKAQQGYSRLEIARKRAALERVLVPETLDAHVRRLREAGFGTVTPWFQCFNFVSMLARP